MKMLSSHFSERECACRCGCGFDQVPPRMLGLAEKVREVLSNVPMIVHSVCRCPDRNKQVGGVKNSQHLQGKAMDFHAKGLSNEEAYKKIKSAFNSGQLPELGGLFLYDWGVHIDVRPIPDGRLRTADYREVSRNDS